MELLDITPHIFVDRCTGSSNCIPLGALLEESLSNPHHVLQSSTQRDRSVNSGSQFVLEYLKQVMIELTGYYYYYYNYARCR
jgi:hypothetical protein